MSKLSEEEIINIIENVLSNKEIGLLEATDTFYQAIQGLLDLYQKEKEEIKKLIKRNKELEEIFKQFNAIHKDKIFCRRNSL